MLSNLKNKIWYEKYRPATINDYVFHNEKYKQMILKYIETQEIPHLLLSGGPGSGKTTLVKILIKELNIDPMDVLYINASQETSVDMVRDKIFNFISSFGHGEFRLVHLEEADRLSANGQDALKAMMEDYASVARFVLTTNVENKIVPAIRSRVTHFKFKVVDKDDLTLYLADILKKEKVKCDLDTLDQFIEASYPDIRQIINKIQQYSSTGTLLPLLETAKDVPDYKEELIRLASEDNWNDARKMLVSKVSNDEWGDIFKFFYENLHNWGKFKNQDTWEAGIVTIAEHLYRDGLIADREINVAAMLIKLAQI